MASKGDAAIIECVLYADHAGHVGAASSSESSLSKNGVRQRIAGTHAAEGPQLHPSLLGGTGPRHCGARCWRRIASSKVSGMLARRLCEPGQWLHTNAGELQQRYTFSVADEEGQAFAFLTGIGDTRPRRVHSI